VSTNNVRGRARDWRKKWERCAESEALKARKHPQHGSAKRFLAPKAAIALWLRDRIRSVWLQGSTATVRGAVFISSGCSSSLLQKDGPHSACVALRKAEAASNTPS
jgi:hypothetical protein